MLALATNINCTQMLRLNRTQNTSQSPISHIKDLGISDGVADQQATYMLPIGSYLKGIASFVVTRHMESFHVFSHIHGCEHLGTCETLINSVGTLAFQHTARAKAL